MKLILERSDALSALTRVTGVVAARSNVDILKNVLIVADKNNVTFRATDLDMEATSECPAAISEAGSLTVDANKLREVVQASAQGSQISAELIDGRLNIKSGRSRFKLPVLAADMFPAIPADDYAATFDIEAEVFADALTRTVFAAGTDMSKPALIGSYLTVDGKELLAVGCSGRRFATIRNTLPKGAAKMPSVIIPTKAVAQITRLLSDADRATVSVSANKVRVKTDASEIVAKVIDYPYLEYGRGIPSDVPHVAHVDRDAMIAAVRRALIAGETDSVGVGIRLTFTAGLLSLSGKNPIEEATDEIEIEYDGPEISFGLTAPYVLDAISNLEGETIHIGIGEDLPVSVFTSPTDAVAMNTAVKRIMK